MLRGFLEGTGAYEGRICKSIGQRVVEQVFERSLTGQENPRPIGRATECWKIIQPVQPCSTNRGSSRARPRPVRQILDQSEDDQKV